MSASQARLALDRRSTARFLQTLVDPPQVGLVEESCPPCDGDATASLVDVDVRRRLLSFVMEHPGCTLHRASKGIGLPRARLLRHLTPLKETGAVAEIGAKPRTLLVVNCAGIQQHSDQLRTLADPDVRTVYQWLRSLGPTQPQQVIRMAAERRGWPRATIQRWLSQLVKVGLAEHRREGRLWTQIESRAPAPPVSTALRLAESAGSPGPDVSGPASLGTLHDIAK